MRCNQICRNGLFCVGGQAARNPAARNGSVLCDWMIIMLSDSVGYNHFDTLVLTSTGGYGMRGEYRLKLKAIK